MRVVVRQLPGAAGAALIGNGLAAAVAVFGLDDPGSAAGGFKTMAAVSGSAAQLADLESGGDKKKQQRSHRPGKWVDLSLAWVLPWVLKGYRTPLDEEEVPMHNRREEADFLTARAEELWAEQLEKLPREKTSLVRLMLSLQGFEFYMGLLLSVLQGVLFSVARPLLLRKIINMVSDPATTDALGVAVAICFAIVIMLEGFLQAQVKQLLSCQLGIRYIAWMSSLVHRKSTTVSTAAVSKAGLQEQSLIGSDVTRMVEDWRWMCMLPYVFTALIGGVVILAYVLRRASIVGFVIMFSIAFANFRITKLVKRVEEKDFALGDQRISILREILDGVKAIKMMAWEIPFQKLITKARTDETWYIKRFRTLTVTSINLGRASPILAACFSILTLAVTDPDSLNAATIFVAISSFQGLRLPLIAVPQQTTMLANSLVSFGRLRKYLLLDDAPPADALPENSPLAVEVSGASFSWSRRNPAATGSPPSASPESETTEAQKATVEPVASMSQTGEFGLHDIDFSVRSRDHLVAIVGKVGSGKSSLLSSILGSMFLDEGSVRLTNKIAYIPQKPFIMSGTARENVLMGHPFEEEKFNRILHASALDVDLAHMPDGAETEIGERGQTFSGGQAARLSIARALYHDAELLLMDDILAAVDPEVANNLFRRTVLGFMGRSSSLRVERGGRRSVLMTLNQLHLLQYFDHIIVMDDACTGRIAEQGAYAELMSRHGGPLWRMMHGEVKVKADDAPADAGSVTEDEEVDEDDVKAGLEEANNPATSAKGDPISATDAAGATATTAGGAISEEAALKVEEEAEEEEDMDDAKMGVEMHEPRLMSSEMESVQGTKESDFVRHHVLVDKEKGEKGAVSSRILQEYLTAMGRGRLPFSFLFALVAYAFMGASDMYLASWTSKAASIEDQSEHLHHAAIYIALGVCNVIGIEILSLHNTGSSVAASKNVHGGCIDHILHAPITWYEKTPSGRIVSRFSGDLSMVDRQLAFIFDDVFQFVFLLLSLAVVVCYIVPELVPVIFVGLALFIWQVVAVDRTNREVKRYSNQSLSPILTNISETIDARELIRCMQLENFFKLRHYSHVDRYTTNLYFSYTLVNFSTLVSGIVSFMLSLGAAMVVMLRREKYDPALVGLAVSYSLLLPYFLAILSNALPIGFAALTSLERIVELKSDQVSQEPAWYLEADMELVDGHAKSWAANELDPETGEPSAPRLIDAEVLGSVPVAERAWPTHGRLDFERVVLQYRPDLPPALKDVTFSIEGGQKVGVVGRSGSGKSTLATIALFRVHELTSGRIMLDGQDISRIGLQLLRSSLTIIPQQPLLLKSRGLRGNLDPFDEHSDSDLLAAMDRVGLSRDLLKPKANGEDAEEALALSIGERQLLSLARAILRKSLKVVVLDEPTSSLDMRSDEQIQKVVQTAFAQSTVMMIAHRINTIRHCERILVMDDGNMVEFDHPDTLLADPNSTFSSMVAATEASENAL
ncbi:ABC transporter, putative [Hondaea fermentalgiana]|uniref:ABC transporter, putative n=1 Tax=Hondaea fermentalgiana TaxID=2315210 RepID=A0A2R5G8Q2_9STRA|nr:ABC transporter, putative [Hondaea fermentalgiana]|eukprot:GBG27380.1 ABC transporter, putative [Hondaea fermentalgiana]